MSRFTSRVAARFKSRRLRVTLQGEVTECAHACLSMVLSHHGQDWPMAHLRERFTPSTRGTNVSSLVGMAQDLGMNARIYRAEPAHLGQLKMPCVLHWDVSHFVVLESCADGLFQVVDPSIGRTSIGEAEFNSRFTGIVVEMTPGIEFRREAPSINTSALALLREGLRERVGTIATVVVLALMLEVLTLVSPLFIQAVTDAVLPGNDDRLLLILGVAFMAAALLQVAVSLSRTSLLIRLSEELTVGWNSAVGGRLLQLPYIFFMRRSIGDIHSRFGSIEEVQRTITHRFVEGVLDGATSLLSLAIILAYSPALAAVTLCFSLAYGLFRIITLPRLLQATERGIQLQSAQQGLLLEMLHGIHSIKASGRETNQLARYNRKTRDAAHAAMLVQRWTGTVDEAGQSIMRLHWIAAVGVGAALVMQGNITAGMLIAYVTYAYQFSMRSTRLLDLMSEWRMLLLHGMRLADIVSATPQSAGGTHAAHPDRNDFSIRGLQFRYNADGPPVLRGLDLEVGSGECIAIKGPSGSGKSTLGKLMIGLLEPDDGEILIGGKAIGSLKREALREQIACVLQDDQLFSGTIAENIAFFEPGFSREDAITAARLAQIHDEIMAMPLRYDSRIIDLGASLSGGQRQRLILARALYRNPRILILDEASSHLDLDNERLVNQAIRNLRITRIIIAHRPETLATADRVLELRDGQLVEEWAPMAQPMPVSARAQT
ncbi:MAG: peptidase domain-containing ABC transporter [Lysobacter sp.]